MKEGFSFLHCELSPCEVLRMIYLCTTGNRRNAALLGKECDGIIVYGRTSKYIFSSLRVQ